MASYQFKAALEKAIGGTIEHYVQIKERSWVQFEVHRELDFPTVHRISKVLGTDHITLGSGYSPGGCDTCGFGEDWWLTVSAEGVKF